MSHQNIEKLKEEYLDILSFEIASPDLEPTELKHLIGRLGEFYYLPQTDGELAKETTQHGFDVVNNERKISVKTTDQIIWIYPD